MAEPQSPETKTSKKPSIQLRVEEAKGKIQDLFPDAAPDIVNRYARDRVAAGLRGERQRQQKEKVAMYDHLTGMLNRRWFDNELKQRVAELRRLRDEEKPLWILYFDLDNFKEVNTQYGETPGGDSVLKLVSELPFREEGPIARLGGEEFGQIIDEQVTEEQLASIVVRYMAAIKETTTKELASRQTVIKVNPEERIKEVTISFGLAKYTPGDSPETFLKRANTAMRQAKETGRNKVVIAEPLDPSRGGLERGEYTFRDLQPVFPPSN